MNTLKNIPSLDLAKFLCALLILFYHYFSEQPNPIPWVLEESLSLYAVAVALFMSISGFLVYRKLATLTTRVERWCYIKKQVARILLIYGLWSIPYLIFNISRWNVDEINLSFVLWQIQGWVFKSTFHTIWFLPALAIGLLLSFVLTEYFTKSKQYITALLVYIVGAFLSTYGFVGKQILPIWDVVHNFVDTWLGGTRGGIFYALPLIMVGRLLTIKKQAKNIRYYFSFSILSMLALVLEAICLRCVANAHTGIDNTVCMLVVVFYILSFLLEVRLPMRAYCIWMRKMSILVFVSQRLFLTVLRTIFVSLYTSNFYTNVWKGFLIICGADILFCMLILLISKKVYLVRKLY